MNRFLTAIIILLVPFGGTCRADSAYSRLMSRPGKVLMDEANHYLSALHQPDSAMVRYALVASRYREGMDDGEAATCVSAMNDLGYMYFFYYFDYEKAFACFNRCLHLAERHGNEDVLPYVFLNMANLYRSYNEQIGSEEMDTLALSYYKKAFREAHRLGNWHVFTVAFYGLGHYVFCHGQTRLMSGEIALFRQTRLPAGVWLADFNGHFVLAIEAYGRGDYAETIRQLDEMTRNIDTSFTPERYLVMTLQKKAHVLALLKRFDEAIASLKEAETLTRRHGIRDLEVDVCGDLFRTYRQEGVADTADRYQLRYLQKKDSLLSFNKMKAVGGMRLHQEIDEASRRAEIIAAQRDTRTVMLLAAALLLVATAAFLFVTIRNYRRLQHDHKLLYMKSVEALKRDDERLSAAQKQRDEGEEDFSEIRQQITNVMETTQEIFSEDFSMNRLAELVGRKYWYVSRAINEIYGKNFSALLNEYRIKEACRRLGNFADYGNFTIEGIAKSVGFRSRPYFVQTFKSHVGLTPSEYQKEARRSLARQ